MTEYSTGETGHLECGSHPVTTLRLGKVVTGYLGNYMVLNNPTNSSKWPPGLHSNINRLTRGLDHAR